MAVMSNDSAGNERARLYVRKVNGGEILSAASAAALGQRADVSPDLPVEMVRVRGRAGLSQPRRAGSGGVRRNLRHSRRRRARSRGIWKGMDVGDPAFLDQRERVLEHRFGLGREAGDEVGAEHDIGPRMADRAAEVDCMAARMSALHALEDEVIARLQREMQVRHKPLLRRDRVEQCRIEFGHVERRETQPGKVRNFAPGCA